VTRDFSSWAIADLPPGSSDIRLAVTRRGDAVEVRYSTVPAADAPAQDFTLAALAYLPPGREVLAGVMCAAPEGGGFPVTFRGLTITT